MDNKTLTKAEQNALSVSYDVLGSHVEIDLDFVKRYLVRGGKPVSDQEAVFFMNTCKMQKLNPLVAGEVYLIKYSADDPAQMVVGKNAYLRRAFEHPDYLFKEEGIIVQRGNEIVKKEGCCPYPGENLIGGWCRVHFTRSGKERQAYKEVSLEEYSSGKSNWRSKPATMICKVAQSQCVRDAFPKDYEGLYSEEEMIASGAIPVDDNGKVIGRDEPTANVGNMTDIPDEDQDPFITQEQRQALFRTARAAFGKEGGNEVIQNLLKEAGIENTSSMRTSQYAEFSALLFEICASKNESDERLGQQNDQPT